jgi:hypothetical protein
MRVLLAWVRSECLRTHAGGNAKPEAGSVAFALKQGDTIIARGAEIGKGPIAR